METTLASLIHRLSQVVEAEVEKQLPGIETVRQLAVLETVRQLESCSQRQIAQATGIDRSTLSDIVRRLLERGHLHRRRSLADARAYNVSLTHTGADLLREHAVIQRRVEQQILAKLKRPERVALVDAMQKLLKTLDK